MICSPLLRHLLLLKWNSTISRRIDSKRWFLRRRPPSFHNTRCDCLTTQQLPGNRLRRNRSLSNHSLLPAKAMGKLFYHLQDWLGDRMQDWTRKENQNEFNLCSFVNGICFIIKCIQIEKKESWSVTSNIYIFLATVQDFIFSDCK